MAGAYFFMLPDFKCLLRVFPGQEGPEAYARRLFKLSHSAQSYVKWKVLPCGPNPNMFAGVQIKLHEVPHRFEIRKQVKSKVLEFRHCSHATESQNPQFHAQTCCQIKCKVYHFRAGDATSSRKFKLYRANRPKRKSFRAKYPPKLRTTNSNVQRYSNAKCPNKSINAEMRNHRQWTNRTPR